MKGYSLVLAFLLLLTASAFAQAQREALNYLLYANKGKIGYWDVVRTEKNGEVIYESEREIVFKLLKAIRTLTVQRSVFREGRLERAELQVSVNGDPRRQVRLEWKGDHYRYEVSGEPVRRIEQAITFTQIRLFFEMPSEGEAVFVERDGVFLPPHRIDDNSLGVTLPNGEINRFDYFEGRVARGVLEDGILHTYLRLRKQKNTGGGKPTSR